MKVYMVRKKRVSKVSIVLSFEDSRRFADFFQVLMVVDVNMKKAKKRSAKKQHDGYSVGSARLHSDYRRIDSRSFKLRRALPFPLDKAVRPHDHEVFLFLPKNIFLENAASWGNA